MKKKDNIEKNVKETVDNAKETAGNAEATVENHELTELEKLQSDYNDINDKYLRALAEYDNFRKRSIREKENIAIDAKISVIEKLLPVIDNLERALASGNENDSLQKGVEMIMTQLTQTLADIGVEAFGKIGEHFDPNFHNAVMHDEDESENINVISDVFVKGYKFGDRVIRPAAVKVIN
ncbi:MAG TPA: nucleotide exchange factor GrpE [Clostridiales bacterium]|nr:nucleotide exchange factor GrpE [Clostridiales bacterium]